MPAYQVATLGATESGAAWTNLAEVVTSLGPVPSTSGNGIGNWPRAVGRNGG